MNTIRKTIAFLALASTLVAFNANASERVDPRAEAARQYTVNAYISALSSGDVSDVEKLFDNNVKFDIKGNQKQFSFGKKEMIDFMKTTKNVVQQDCKTSFDWIETDASDVAVAKITQNYPEFTRTNYVTMVFNGNDWKITHVQTLFN
ncbi:MAG: nuclear transport factor 2 family protein [Mucilaginibacter polytrichastri]|nr:nuclear transport factor 2 family protein [Mucilaginibacter polytrichastri]